MLALHAACGLSSGLGHHSFPRLRCMRPARTASPYVLLPASSFSNTRQPASVPRSFIHAQLSNTKITLSPLKNILLINLSLFTPFPPFPCFSVHISLTFSSTMLQCRSKALTRARSLRLLRQDIRTCVCVRVAVMRIERGPVESSWASTRRLRTLWDDVSVGLVQCVV